MSLKMVQIDEKTANRMQRAKSGRRRQVYWFVRGVGSVIDVWPHTKYRAMYRRRRGVIQTLGDDFQKIGHDLGIAIRRVKGRYARELDEEQAESSLSISR